MRTLDGKIALVTGASRGIGKGIALSLGEAGAIVYVTGRTVEEGQESRGLSGTIHQTAAEVAGRGGNCIALRCDHRRDEQVEEVFRHIRDEQGRLDILVNNVWGGYEPFQEITDYFNKGKFWTAPLSQWDAMFQAGVRAHYSASFFAVPLLIARNSSLIVNISFIAAQKNDSGVIYSTSKAADDRLAACMAYELRPYNVAVVSLYPGGMVRTEWVMRTAKNWRNLSGSESPEFTGRAIAALAADPEIMRWSGKILEVAALAREYGFTDIDGTVPGV
jgi:NAD(P)-dependent dehydrogenase (short-subunit alcohol dehydrogenase family)